MPFEEAESIREKTNAGRDLESIEGVRSSQGRCRLYTVHYILVRVRTPGEDSVSKWATTGARNNETAEEKFSLNCFGRNTNRWSVESKPHRHHQFLYFPGVIMLSHSNHIAFVHSLFVSFFDLILINPLRPMLR